MSVEALIHNKGKPFYIQQLKLKICRFIGGLGKQNKISNFYTQSKLAPYVR